MSKQEDCARSFICIEKHNLFDLVQHPLRSNHGWKPVNGVQSTCSWGMLYFFRKLSWAAKLATTVAYSVLDLSLRQTCKWAVQLGSDQAPAEKGSNRRWNIPSPSSLLLVAHHSTWILDWIKCELMRFNNESDFFKASPIGGASKIGSEATLWHSDKSPSVRPLRKLSSHSKNSLPKKNSSPMKAESRSLNSSSPSLGSNLGTYESHSLRQWQ